MRHLPAHPGFQPSAFQYVPVTGALEAQLRSACGARRAARAVHAKLPPLGYYRLEGAGDRELAFGRVVLREDAQRIDAGLRLSAAAAAAGVPAVAQPSGPLELDEQHVLFLCEWLDGRFGGGSGDELAALGAVVAGLHAFLREHPLACAPAVDWPALERLLERGQLPHAAANQVEQLLGRRDEVERSVRAGAQALHNDLHPGNVLFAADGRVLAVLDFEEALRSVASPWRDLSWVVERFCFVGKTDAASEALALAFLGAYRARGGMPQPPASSETLADLMELRACEALALLDAEAARSGQLVEGEWRKHLALLGDIQARRQLLARICGAQA